MKSISIELTEIELGGKEMGLTPSQHLMEALSVINNEKILDSVRGFKSTNRKYKPFMIKSIKEAIQNLEKLIEQEE